MKAKILVPDAREVWYSADWEDPVYEIYRAREIKLPLFDLRIEQVDDEYYVAAKIPRGAVFVGDLISANAVDVDMVYSFYAAFVRPLYKYHIVPSGWLESATAYCAGRWFAACPPFGQTELTPGIKSVKTYFRTLCRFLGPPWSTMYYAGKRTAA